MPLSYAQRQRPPYDRTAQNVLHTDALILYLSIC